MGRIRWIVKSEKERLRMKNERTLKSALKCIRILDASRVSLTAAYKAAFKTGYQRPSMTPSPLRPLQKQYDLWVFPRLWSRLFLGYFVVFLPLLPVLIGIRHRLPELSVLIVGYVVPFILLLLNLVLLRLSRKINVRSLIEAYLEIVGSLVREHNLTPRGPLVLFHNDYSGLIYYPRNNHYEARFE